MKRAIAFIIMTHISLSLFSQHNPPIIAQQMKEMNERLSKYDNDDILDSAWILLSSHIQEAETAYKRDGAQSALAAQCIWRAYRAHTLATYAKGQQWRIQARTEGAANGDNDIKTWDLTMMMKKILSESEMILAQREALMQIDAKPYLSLFDSVNEIRYYATLYDFLAMQCAEAIDLCDLMTSKPLHEFDINQPAFFSEQIGELSSPDPLSSKYNHLRILQKLQQAHTATEERSIANYFRILRLKYVYEECTLPEKDSLYTTQLEKIFEEEGNGFIAQLAAQRLGDYYGTRAEKSTIANEDFLTAIAWYEKAIAALPLSECAKTCTQSISAIQQELFTFSYQTTIYPENQLIQFTTKELDKLYYLIAKGSIIYNRKSVTLNTVQSGSLAISPNHLHFPDTTLMEIDALQPGLYTLIVSKEPLSKSSLTQQQLSECKTAEIRVSRLNCAYIIENDTLTVWVCDRKSGTPISGANIRLTNEGYAKPSFAKVAQSDKEGRAIFSMSHTEMNGSYKLNVYTADDQMPEMTIYKGSHYSWDEPSNYSCAIYTDRAIYRPGQKVQWKAVLTKESQYDSELAPAEELTVELSSYNGVIISKKVVVTNEFGSAAGEFELPTDGFLGNYEISIHRKRSYTGGCMFRVEEYKRPTFEVALEEPKGTYRIGEQVEIKGSAKAFAGYAVQDAKVSYRVTRQTSFPFRYWGWWLNPYSESSKEIAQGECTTDADGQFTITFTAEGDNETSRYKPLFDYRIEATVCDVTGETHNSSSSVRVSEQTLIYDIELPDCIYLDHTDNHFPLTVNNLSGFPQQAAVSYELCSLDMPEHFKIAPPYTYGGKDASQQFAERFPQYAFNGENQPHNWKEGKTAVRGILNTSEKSFLEIAKLHQLKSGAYKLKLSTQDPYGTSVEEERIFYIAKNRKEFPVYSILEVDAEKSIAEVGDTAIFHISSYLGKQDVLIRICSNDKVIEQKWIKVSKESFTFTHVVSAGEEGTLSCYASLFHEGQSHHQSARVTIPDRKRAIQFEFITFRDKVNPGATEQVRIILKDENGKGLKGSELLCGMYDASLDALAGSNSWSKVFSYGYPSAQTIRLSNFNTEVHLHYLSYGRRASYQLEIPSWKYMINLYYNYFRGGRVMLCKAADNANRANLACFDDAQPAEAFEMAEFGEMTEMSELSNSVSETPEAPNGCETKDANIAMRSNFAETAFFYPFLRTNENGDIEFEYTIPESLTQWKMMGVAHSLDRRSSTFVKSLLTQKELMVVPNTPRFAREGDHWQFAAKVVNMSASPLNGEAELKVFNAETNEEIATHRCGIALAANATDALRFDVDVPLGTTALTYRIWVRATGDVATYTDGEENILPVLSRRMLLTETLPIFITQKGSKHFSLKDIPAGNNTIVSCKLLFTPDPKWNAVLALPYLMEYPYDCNEQLFSKLYANIISARICQQNPSWETLLEGVAESNPEALLSKLEAHPELKQILLEETPWVRDAQNEDDAIQNIACIFDTKRVNEECLSMVRKITKNQNMDGGWHWFAKDDRYTSSPYITQHILIGAGRLIEKGICKPGKEFLSEKTLNNAVHFIDKEASRAYQELKKEQPDYTKGNHLGCGIVHYLYARSFYLKGSKPNTEAYRFYENQLVSYAKELDNIYLKAMAALTLYQMKESKYQKLAADLMADIKKQAIHSEELGMYWRKNGVGYYWSESLIERQSLLIEAFKTILHDNQSVDEMKIWLLQQKRTQHWSTTRSTADACYALLLDDEAHKASSHDKITLTLCGDTLDFGDTLQAPIKRDMVGCIGNGSDGDIILSRNQNGLAYGGVLVQYYKDIDEVVATCAEMPLSVERQLFRVVLGERGEVLSPLSQEEALRAGDRVRVRMVLHCDRDLEYVHLKDLRAAAFEPTETLSGYRYQDGLYYYQSFRDASVNIFFDHIYKGTYVFEYTLFATQTGTYSSGYASAQCMYAPEFSAHSAGNGRVTIGE